MKKYLIYIAILVSALLPLQAQGQESGEGKLLDPTRPLWQQNNPDGENYLENRRALVGRGCAVNKLVNVVGVGSWIEDLDNLTDEDLNNYTAFPKIVGAGVGSNPIVSVRDMNNYYAAGTEEALEIARAEMRNMIRFLIPFMALCASVAAYLIKNGLDTDPFSFNSFSLFGQMRSMSWCGITGVVLFVLAVLSQTPQRGAVSGTLLLAEDELTDYDGAQRGILQIWSVVRSFVVVAVVTYIVFPSDLIGAFGESAAIAWSGQAVNFIVFWLSVAAARIAVVPLCRSAMALVERPLPVDARGGAVYLLTVAAVLLLWYEGIVLSMEAAAF